MTPKSDESRSATVSGNKLSPQGLYIHVPWCRRRCSYCDFAFDVGRVSLSYAPALIGEWKSRRGELNASPLRSIYFGGGTPSLLGEGTIATILDAVRSDHALSDDVEITLEANPEDIDADHPKRWRQAGITRVSLGIQSLDNDTLAYLGRVHRAQQALAAIESCRRADLKICADLIVGVPRETAQRRTRDVDGLIDAGAGQLSVYQLTVEKGTPLEKMIRNKRRLPTDDDKQAVAYEKVQEELVRRGFAQIEVASFSSSGNEPVHNRLYWGKGEYLGLGPSAASLRFDDDGAAHRRTNTRNVSGWLATDAEEIQHNVETLSAPEALAEALAFGVRDVAAGVDVAMLEERHLTKLSPSREHAIDRHVDEGLLWRSGTTVGLTHMGARFADRVARDLL